MLNDPQRHAKRLEVRNQPNDAFCDTRTIQAPNALLIEPVEIIQVEDVNIMR
jgi:hypothetical protein